MGWFLFSFLFCQLLLVQLACLQIYMPLLSHGGLYVEKDRYSFCRRCNPDALFRAVALCGAGWLQVKLTVQPFDNQRTIS